MNVGCGEETSVNCVCCVILGFLDRFDVKRCAKSGRVQILLLHSEMAFAGGGRLWQMFFD